MEKVQDKRQSHSPYVKITSNTIMCNPKIRKRFFISTALFTIFLFLQLLITDICSAQEYQEPLSKQFSQHLYFGGKLGMAMFDGDIKNTWENGIGGTGIAGLRFTPNWTFEGEFFVYFHNPIASKNKMYNYWTHEEIEIYKNAGYFGFLMSAKYTPIQMSDTKIVPFISPGVGFQMFMWDLTEDAWMYTDMESTDGLYGTAFSLSVGADYYVSKQILINANIRYVYHQWSDELQMSEEKVDLDGNSFVLTVGGAFQLF